MTPEDETLTQVRFERKAQFRSSHRSSNCVFFSRVRSGMSAKGLS